MPELSRRRFLTIAAAAGGALAFGKYGRAAPPLAHWRGVALGADASITLRHPEADRIVAAALAEIERLENIFSLYRAHSAISRLNAHGRLDQPPFEMLELLGMCGAVHAATGGLFDPTIQPVWATYAEHYANGRAPEEDAIRAALAKVGWPGVTVEASALTVADPGMALTLNGIAQGYIADRVVAFLRGEGLRDVLVNTGEYRALGGHPDGGSWPVSLRDGERLLEMPVHLRDLALATSATLGTAFDVEGKVGHILHPATGRPCAPTWRLISVTGPSAALADALSTAMCLMTRAEIKSVLDSFPGFRLAHLG
jgi:FAD:protein FMN transferase